MTFPFDISQVHNRVICEKPWLIKKIKRFDRIDDDGTMHFAVYIEDAGGNLVWMRNIDTPCLEEMAYEVCTAWAHYIPVLKEIL